VNKPELDFDEFMKIEVGPCSAEQNQVQTSSALPTKDKPVTTEVPRTETNKDTFKVTTTPKPSTPTPIIEEEDDLTAPVPSDATCKRIGCKVVFVSDEDSRMGDGEASVCTYHPAAPIFHEGSKGYLCCKRRVLEFDEFMKIEGCKKGRHVFVPKKIVQEQVVTTCRIDHYQTPKTVCVSVFAKKADKERSKVSFEESQVHLDLYLPDSKRFQRSLNLYGTILPDESSFSILGTKVELNLQKKDSRSWNLLEATDKDIGSFNLIFGVGGRTGTVGAREAVIESTNRLST